MIVFKLLSFPSTNDGTFGAMFHQDKDGFWIPFVLTIERKWLNNEKGKSCIPRPAERLCKRVNSPKFGDTFEVTGVEGRSEILFHKGNIDDDSHGCIILGSTFDDVLDKTGSGFSPGVISSKAAMDKFLKKLNGQQEFKLVMEWV